MKGEDEGEREALLNTGVQHQAAVRAELRISKGVRLYAQQEAIARS